MVEPFSSVRALPPKWTEEMRYSYEECLTRVSDFSVSGFRLKPPF